MYLKRKIICPLVIATLLLQPVATMPMHLQTSHTQKIHATTNADKTITLYANGTKNKSKKIHISSDTLNIEELYFISSDPSIATVDRESGKVTAVKKGTATVTVYVTASGINKIFTVQVKVKNPYVKIKKSVKKLKVGKRFVFKAKAYGLKGKIKWKSSNPKIAKINASTGKVTAKKVGKVKIIAKCGKKTAKVNLRIKKLRKYLKIKGS